MAYIAHPIIEVDLARVQLDLDNYRIPTRPSDERAAMAYLFSSEDVIGAARSILRDGYFDNEVPIVIAGGPPPAKARADDQPPAAEDRSYIVIEGNRRVAALKALLGPEVAPNHQTELASLRKQYEIEAANLPTTIRVIVAPSRETAAPHIARLHTGQPKRRWSRDQQANFYHSLLDKSTTVEDVKAAYPGVNVVRFMQMIAMRKFVSSAPYTDATLADYAKSTKLTMSALEYAYRNSDIARVIGTAFNAEGRLVPADKSPETIAAHLPQAELAALEYLVAGFRSGLLSTRADAFKKRKYPRAYEALLETLECAWQSRSPSSDSSSARESSQDVPSRGRPNAAETVSGGGGSTRGGSGGNSESEQRDESTGGKGSRGPNSPDSKDGLDLTAIRYDLAPYGLKKRFIELRGLRLSTQPVATAVMLRVVFEGTVKWHLAEVAGKPSSGLLGEVFPDVKDLYGKDRSIRQNIDRVYSGNAQQPGSITWLNLATHSTDTDVTATDVRTAFALVGPILRYLMRPRA